MSAKQLNRRTGLLLVVAVLWAFGGAFGVVQLTGVGGPVAVAADNPCTAAPSAPAPAPSGAEDDSHIPWDTPADTANGAAANPCNPNPCNPCGGGGQASKVRIEYALDYLRGGYERVTGYVRSAAHGDRLLVTYIAPAEAAQVYRHNAKLAREGRGGGFQDYPEGTTILAQSLEPDAQGRPAARSPIYIMEKTAASMDSHDMNWRYRMAQADMTLVANVEGNGQQMCRSCHMSMKARDYVSAVTR